MSDAQPTRRDPLEEWLDVVPDQAELDALGRLLRGAKRKPTATLRCPRHHALARVFDVEGATILVRDPIREIGGPRAEPVGTERKIETDVKRRGSHTGSVSMRCRCGNFHSSIADVWASLDALDPGETEIFIDHRTWPTTNNEDFAARQQQASDALARRTQRHPGRQ